MGRALLVLTTDADRRKATEWIAKAPVGTRVEFKASKRSLPQNDRFWAMLTDISQQREHYGRKYKPDVWKAIMMQAWGKEHPQYVPGIDENDVVVLGYSSSDLSKEEMSDLMEFMSAWCAENGITLHEPEDRE